MGDQTSQTTWTAFKILMRKLDITSRESKLRTLDKKQDMVLRRRREERRELKDRRFLVIFCRHGEKERFQATIRLLMISFFTLYQIVIL